MPIFETFLHSQIRVLVLTISCVLDRWIYGIIIFHCFRNEIYCIPIKQLLEYVVGFKIGIYMIFVPIYLRMRKSGIKCWLWFGSCMVNIPCRHCQKLNQNVYLCASFSILSRILEFCLVLCTDKIYICRDS